MSVTCEETYMDAFWALFPNAESKLRVKTLRDQSHPRTIAFLKSVDDNAPMDIKAIPKHLPFGHVAVVEDVDLGWIQALGTAWDVDPFFFVEHTQRKGKSSHVWKEVFGTSPANQKRPWSHTSQYSGPGGSPNAVRITRDTHWHVDGLALHGHGIALEGNVSTHDALGMRTSAIEETLHRGKTRVSCYRKDKGGCLILVDADRTTSQNGGSVTNRRKFLFLPVANNRGGLPIPELFAQNHFSLRDIFHQFLNHSWHFDILFPNSDSPPTPETLFHLVTASTWSANYRYLESRIRLIALKELRWPSVDINDRLHACRADLVDMQSRTAAAQKWMPGSVTEELELIRRSASPGQTYIGCPDAILGELQTDLMALEKFLMDSFNLLMSSMSVLEARRSIEQAERAQRLTLLAFIYIPLSFVTGIFGMNVKEINGSPLSLGVFFTVLAIATALTGVVFAGFVWWGKAFVFLMTTCRFPRPEV